MFFIIFLLALAIALSVASLIGVIYFLYKKKMKLALVSGGVLIALILLMLALCFFSNTRSSGDAWQQRMNDTEAVVE